MTIRRIFNIEKAKRLKTVEEEFGIGRKVDPQVEIDALRKLNSSLELKMLELKEELKKFNDEEVIKDLIDILDLIWKSYKHSREPHTLSLINSFVIKVIEKYGGTIFGTEGDDYNPAIHSLVGYTDHDDDPTIKVGQVSNVLSKGAVIGEKLIRPARVIIKQ